VLAALLSGCGGRAPRPAVEPPAAVKQATGPVAPAAPATTPKGGGGYYLDDGPGDNPPADLEAIPDAVPKREALHRYANRPYSVLGADYTPMTEPRPYRARGIASWYGRKFHGQKTSSGEAYDMYGMTAAHPTLPIPSYARVSNPANGRSVVVRINDRGPFHAGRLIDLSYTAAWKLGYVGNGSTLVEVASILPGMAQPPVLSPRADDDPLARLLTGAEPPHQPLPEISDARGTWLQLGAFGSADNAEALRGRLARELGQLAERLVVRSSGGMHRVQLGPWPDRAEAQRMAAQIAETLEFRPVVVQR
jgi:rare lipoprotein A